MKRAEEDISYQVNHLHCEAEFDDVFSEKNTGISVYLRDIIKELLITRMECDL